MRRSGLTHLLSVSGLHIAAVVGAAMLLDTQAAGAERARWRCASTWSWSRRRSAAGTGIGYTLLTGAQVPTVRSCIAALLVLAGIALGRDAISMRLIAVGALLVLLFRPEALAGASFQMSFAAVTAIVALHSTRWARRMFERRDEGWSRGSGALCSALVATGLVGRARPDSDRALPFPPRGPVRRRRQHRRHPAHHLRHHAARGGRAAARRGRRGRAACGGCAGLVARRAARSRPFGRQLSRERSR